MHRVRKEGLERNRAATGGSVPITHSVTASRSHASDRSSRCADAATAACLSLKCYYATDYSASSSGTATCLHISLTVDEPTGVAGYPVCSYVSKILNISVYLY